MKQDPGFLVYGFGGHGRVLAHLIHEKLNCLVGVFDENESINYPDYVIYLGKYNPNLFQNLPILIGIGDSLIRMKLSKEITHPFYTYIHPSAYVAAPNQIGIGSVILQNAVVQVNSVLGQHCIININVSIDHDVVLDSYINVGANAVIGSNTIISQMANISAGQILPRFSKV